MKFLRSLTEARRLAQGEPPGGFDRDFYHRLWRIFQEVPGHKHSKKFPAKEGWKYAQTKPGIRIALPQGYYGKQQFINAFYYTDEEIYFEVGTLRGAKKYVPSGIRNNRRYGIDEDDFREAEITQYKVLNIF